MADASYERQHLAVHAAGYINGAGTTRVAFGCAMTRIGTGHYGLLLDASAGVVNDETFTFVQAKDAGTGVRLPAVNDDSNVEKRIRVFNQAGTPVDTDIEVELLKSVAR